MTARQKLHVAFPRIQPAIEVPGFSSFPSGHATQASLVSALLAELVLPTLPPEWQPGVQNMLAALALRVGQNREVAGLHYPCDSAAGHALGTALLACWLPGGGAPAGDGLTEAASPPAKLAKSAAVAATRSAPISAATAATVATVATAHPAPIVWLWRQAAAEWAA